jgi:hypothetical protein
VTFRWLWFDFIPPELELTRQQRWRIRRCAAHLRPKSRSDPVNRKAHRYYVRIYVPIMALYFLLLICGALVDSRAIRDRWVLFGIPTMLTAIWVGTAYGRGKTHMPFICQALRDSGYDVCPNCTYLLFGLSDEVSRCPECGWVRERVSA